MMRSLITQFVVHSLNEGGAVGHLSHVFDNPDMTFGEMKQLLTDASEGRLEKVSEKLDGMNVVFTWNVHESRLKVARNSGDVSRGGMSASQLADKFRGRQGLEDAFNSAFEVLTSALSSLSEQELTFVFGENSEKWYSAEVIYSTNPNVVQYDANSVVFHGWPVFAKQPSGAVEKTNDTSGIDLLSSNIDRMQKAMSNADWNIHGPMLVKLKRLSDGSVLAAVLERINDAMSQADVNDDDTISVYTERRVLQIVKKQVASENLAMAITDRIMKKSGGPNLSQLKKMNLAAANEIDALVKNEAKLLKSAMLPIEKAVGDFAVKILEGLDSSLIGNNQKEILRLRAATQEAIDSLQSSGDPNAIAFLQSQLDKLGSVENIKSAMEGIVFVYKGNAYKYTGSFASANQILGFFKYGP